MKNWTYTLFFIGALLLCTTIGQSQGTCTDNLLGNAGFENSPDPLLGWSLNSGTVEVSGDAFSGNNAAVLTEYAQAQISESLPAEPGKKYTFSAMAKMEGDVIIEGQLRIKFLTSSWQPIGFANIIRIKSGNGYESYTVSGVAPTDAAYVQVAAYKRFGNGYFWIDDMCLTVADDPGPCDPAVDPPVITSCPGNIVLYTEGISAPAFWNLAGTSCQSGDISNYSHSPGDLFPLGTTTVTLTRTNFLGLVGTCTFDVIVHQVDLEGCNNNMFSNPGYEDDFNGWDQNGNIGPTVDANSGIFAAVLGSTPVGELSQTFPAEAGETFTMQAIAKKTGNVGVKAGIAFLFFDAQMNFLKAYHNELVNFTTMPAYNPILLQATAPPNTAFVRAGAQKQQGGTYLFLDDWCLISDGSGTNPCSPDNTPPVLLDCGGEVIVTTLSGGTNVDWIPPIATDFCSSVSTINTHSPGDFFEPGTTYVIYTATDDAGNTATCVIPVTVIETNNNSCPNNLLTNPGFEESNIDITDWETTNPSNFNISNDAYSGSNAVRIDGTGYIKIIQQIPALPGEVFTVSAQIKAVTQNHLLRIRFRDAQDNMLSTFQDAEPYNGNYQETTITGTAPNNTASISVSILKLPNPGDVFVDDFCLTKESTVDPCNPDITSPSISGCPNDITLLTNSNGMIANWTPPTGSDNCSNVSISGTSSPGDFFPLGATNVIYMATDASGNSSTCSFTVSVLEDIPGMCVNNLLENSGYEESNNTYPGWHQIGAIGPTISTDAYSGSFALMQDGSSSAGILQKAAADPGDEFTVTVQIKQEENIGFLRLKFLSSTFQPLYQNTHSVAANGTYQELTLTETAPPNTAYVEVGVYKSSSTNGSYLVDDWCLIKETTSNDVDLSFANFNAPQIIEVGKGYNFAFDLVNSSSYAVSENGVFAITVAISEDDQPGAPGELIGYQEVNNLPPGNTSIEIPFVVPEGYAQDQYFIHTILDRYNVINETNEDNNTHILAFDILPNSGSPCAKNFMAGELSCSEYLPNGDLRVVSSIVNNTLLNFETIINEAGEIVSSQQLPSTPLNEPWQIVGDNLEEIHPLGHPIASVPLSADLLAEFELLKVIQFDNGFIITSVNQSKTTLTIFKTDAQTNVLNSVQIPTPFDFQALHSLVEVTNNRFAFVYNEKTGFQGSNQSTLVVMSPGLSVKSSEVISSLSGAVSIATPANLRKTLCGTWAYNSSGGNAGGGGGGSAVRSETMGTYEFVNDEFFLLKSFTEIQDLQYAGGNTSQTNAFLFSGLAPDIGSLVASRYDQISNTFPPIGYLPANHLVNLSKDIDGNIPWSKKLSPAIVYPFEELVQIGDNYFLLYKGTYTSVDCDNNAPNNTTGYPTDCAISSDYPWHEWISRVKISGLDKLSGKSTYTDFTGSTGISAIPGETLPITIDATFSYFAEDQYISIYIDFNGDGLFSTDEVSNGSLTNLANGSNITHTWQGNILVPQNALPLQELKMRIIMQRGSYADGSCNNIPFGEIEDYSFFILASGITLEQQEEAKRLRLFPNPAQEYVFVDVEEFLSEEVSIEVYNNLGQQVYNRDRSNVIRSLEKIDLRGWKNGYYTVWLKPQYGPRRMAKMVVVQTY